MSNEKYEAYHRRLTQQYRWSSIPPGSLAHLAADRRLMVFLGLDIDSAMLWFMAPFGLYSVRLEDGNCIIVPSLHADDAQKSV